MFFHFYSQKQPLTVKVLSTKGSRVLYMIKKIRKMSPFKVTQTSAVFLDS